MTHIPHLPLHPHMTGRRRHCTHPHTSHSTICSRGSEEHDQDRSIHACLDTCVPRTHVHVRVRSHFNENDDRSSPAYLLHEDLHNVYRLLGCGKTGKASSAIQPAPPVERLAAEDEFHLQQLHTSPLRTSWCHRSQQWPTPRKPLFHESHNRTETFCRHPLQTAHASACARANVCIIS